MFDLDLQVPENSQKIVQVGNMLQIVPVDTSIQGTPVQATQVKEELSVDALMKQKVAQRRAEKERRLQERERKKREKEKKKKEKEKKKQLKLKLKTEKMIQKALLLEVEENVSSLESENDKNTLLSTQWPPVPIVISNPSLKPAGKGILVSHGFR